MHWRVDNNLYAFGLFSAGHVLELAEQSENKTLNIFSKVYRRMVPLAQRLIHQLYTEIIK